MPHDPKPSNRAAYGPFVTGGTLRAPRATRAVGQGDWDLAHRPV